MTNRSGLRACVLLTLLSAGGCEQVLPDISWERMIDQARGKPFRPSPYFPDGKLMQAPPRGTIPTERRFGAQFALEGSEAGVYAQRIPMPIDIALMRQGRRHFETICATCHGLDGSGQSVVARHMDLRKPPALTQPPVAELPAGRIFHVISAGYGLMPSFQADLSPADRWAVVASVRALIRSRHAELARLPADLRRQAEEHLE